MDDVITVNIDHTKSYNYIVSDSTEPLIHYIEKHYPSDSIYVVVDERVMELHEQSIKYAISQAGKSAEYFEVPRGEKSKSYKYYKKISDWLLECKIRRTSPVIAIGGGVVGDLAGFVAATILRGVPLIHVPTTLLAMVDSSIGGKTGINHRTGKNLIGSFYQPEMVLANTTFLSTLEQREWINGMSEILKYACIAAPEIFDLIKKAVNDNGFKVSPRWKKLIKLSAGIKTDIVQKDVKEAGIRAYLNFGHTFGHALEKISNYGTFSHGEAVFAGMLAACYYSEKMGGNIKKDQLEDFISYYNLDLSNFIQDKTHLNTLLEAMYYDKKIKHEKIRLILLKKMGIPYTHSVDNKEFLMDAWMYACSKLNNNKYAG